MVDAKRRGAVMGAAAVALLAVGAPAEAFRAGPPPARTGSMASGGQSCRQCHGNNAGSGMVEILGVPAIYEPGTTYDLSVRVSDPVQLGGGFQLSVETGAGAHVGTLIRSDTTNTRFASTIPANTVWLEHSGTGVNNAVANWVANGNSATYTFQWQAPAGDAGPITFWAAGNAINNNFNSLGDIIYLSQVTTVFELCFADIDGDGMVGSSDLSQLLGAWGTNNPAADLDMSGNVDSTDLSQMLGSWGPCS